MANVVRRHSDRAAFVATLEGEYSVRLHATILLTAASLAGLLLSRVMLWMGLETPLLRFPIAVVLAYCVFIVLVDWWLHYLGIRKAQVDDVPDPGGFPSGGKGSSAEGPGPIEGGGGTFDGGGASAGWGDAPAPGAPLRLKAEAVQAKAHAASASMESKATAASAGLEAKAQAGGLAAGDALSAAGAAGEFFPIVVLVAVVALLIGAVSWTVAITPMVLLEIAVEAAVAAGLIRSTSRSRSPGWFMALFDRTVWKVVVLALAALILGIVVRSIDPGADTLGEALTHWMKR